MKHEFTAPLYRILYSEAMPKVTIQGYDLNSQPYSTNRTMDVTKLPYLIFQLIEAGYGVSLEKTMEIFGRDSSHIMVAVTKEYIDHLQSKRKIHE